MQCAIRTSSWFLLKRLEPASMVGGLKIFLPYVLGSFHMNRRKSCGSLDLSSRVARWNVSPRVVSFEVPQQQMHTCVTTSKANIPVILIFFSPSPFPLDDSSQIMHTISSVPSPPKFKWVMIIIISVKMNIQHEICVEATAWKYLNSEPFIQKSTSLCFFSNNWRRFQKINRQKQNSSYENKSS